MLVYWRAFGYWGWVPGREFTDAAGGVVTGESAGGGLGGGGRAPGVYGL